MCNTRAAMFRVTLSIFCLTFGVFISVKSEKSCDTLGTFIYEDLGCRPVKKDGRGCAIQYECDDFTQKNDSCLFRGKTYALNEQIGNELTYEPCYLDCRCEDHLGTANFMCAEIDCPEWLDYPIKPGCYEKFALDQCCSAGRNCPSEDKPAAECSVDGNVYKDGQEFYPKNTCLKCICSKDWKGRLEPPFCQRSWCTSQINNAEELHKKCAPVYFSKEALCCPNTWVCPSPTDHITKINNNVDSNSDLPCVFGSKTLKLGEGLKTKVSYSGRERDVQCECVVPPLLTCKEV